jgi:hypothetical protein
LGLGDVGGHDLTIGDLRVDLVHNLHQCRSGLRTCTDDSCYYWCRNEYHSPNIPFPRSFGSGQFLFDLYRAQHADCSDSYNRESLLVKAY